MRRARAFTLIELMTVVAVSGVLASVGMASMVSIIEAEKARNEASRFAAEVRRQRSEAMQQQMHTLVAVAPNPEGGVRVTYSAKRLGSDTATPCEMMVNGDADVIRTNSFDAIDIALRTGGQPNANHICLDPFGRPMTDTLETSPAEFTVTRDGEEKLSLVMDALGTLNSSDQPVASGIAQTSFYPTDLMLQESAPVPPNAEDVVELPVYEVAPGEYVDADGEPTSGGALGGTDDPCLYDSSYCDPCVIDPASCDPCLLDPTACVMP
jgi:prepilin-type N-terminal cleavage/methylation domain-containing protein